MPVPGALPHDFISALPVPGALSLSPSLSDHTVLAIFQAEIPLIY